MYVSILGRRWNLEFIRKSRTRKWFGQCTPQNEPHRKITIESGHTQETELRILLHEFLHASCYEALDEKFVDETSRDIARILYRLGWRKVTEGPKPVNGVNP